MGCGLATDDRSREEGRHYTDDSAVRLHGCGACSETRVLLLQAQGLPAMAIVRAHRWQPCSCGWRGAARS